MAASNAGAGCEPTVERGDKSASSPDPVLAMAVSGFGGGGWEAVSAIAGAMTGSDAPGKGVGLEPPMASAPADGTGGTRDAPISRARPAAAAAQARRRGGDIL